MKRKIVLSLFAMTLSTGMALLPGMAVMADSEYVVNKGDSLWKIAKTQLGDGASYMKIYEANKAIIRNPNFLQVGWKLIIPDGKTSPGANALTIASPIKEYNSLSQMNAAAGTLLVHPGVMGVTGEKFLVIDDGTDKIAEYSFNINGISYCLRNCPTSLKDISGVYVNGKTAFDGRGYGNDIDFVYTDDMMLARWARVEGQFVLTAKRANGYTEDLFKSIAKEIQAVNAIQKESDEESGSIKSFESKDGWVLSYNTDDFFLNDTLSENEICFNYIGECSGTTAIIISYHPKKMPDEVLYEKVAGIDDSLITRGEGKFSGYWSHYRYVKPANENPNLGNVIYENYTAIEHNGGSVLIDAISHLETDKAQYKRISEATSKLLESFKLVNHAPQTEYSYIPGKYVRKYKEEMEGKMLEFTDIIELKDDHSCSVTFQDTIAGEWTGIKLVLNNGSEYEYSVEGTTLYLNIDGQWLPFERI